MTVNFVAIPGVCGVEIDVKSKSEKCCRIGTSLAVQHLGCDNLAGLAHTPPRMEEVLCLKALEMCCVRAYRKKICEKGMEIARAGAACIQGDQHQRDCCEGCKLGKS